MRQPNGIAPCRNDLSRCPESARQCAPCPHRDPRSLIRCLGRVTTRSPTRQRLPDQRLVRRILFLERLRHLSLSLLAFLCVCLAGVLGVYLANVLTR